MSDVFITGIGTVSPLGTGTGTFFENCFRGKSGIREIERFDPGELQCKVAGTVLDFEPNNWIDQNERKHLSRSVAFLYCAVEEALKRAGLENFSVPEQTGVVLGSGGGPVDFTEDQYEWFFTGEGDPSVYNVPSSTIGNLASELSIQINARGPSHLVSTGCTSSSDAFGHALMTLRNERASCVICGGVDTPITPGVIKGFEKMRVVASQSNGTPEKASRPFHPDRNGFVPGEGCWLTVLETKDHLERRNGPDPLARLAGYGSTCDAHHRVRMKEDGEDGRRAINNALEDADVRPREIDYVNAHGTGTELNDRVESTILNSCFDNVPPTSSTKSMIGHPQGASGS
ncbi:MAG: beta-ketoacyl synthase, partial [bacterium]